jgi:hypothetical protein
MGTASHGLHRRLWAAHSRSAQWRTLTGPWATPPTADAMKIEWGVVDNPTIHHEYFFLEENRHPGHRQGHERRPLPKPRM